MKVRCHYGIRNLITAAAAALCGVSRYPHLMKGRSIQLISCMALVALTACSPPTASEVPPILLFSGTGMSRNDVKAVELILKRSHLKYAKVNSRQLNSMSESQLM